MTVFTNAARLGRPDRVAISSYRSGVDKTIYRILGQRSRFQLQMITCDSTIISNAWHVTAGDHRRVIDQATSAAAQSHINGRFERLTDQAAAATFASSPAICASAGMFTVTK